jgi:hypothetical protein
VNRLARTSASIAAVACLTVASLGAGPALAQEDPVSGRGYGPGVTAAPEAVLGEQAARPEVCVETAGPAAGGTGAAGSTGGSGMTGGAGATGVVGGQGGQATGAGGAAVLGQSAGMGATCEAVLGEQARRLPRALPNTGLGQVDGVEPSTGLGSVPLAAALTAGLLVAATAMRARGQRARR